MQDVTTQVYTNLKNSIIFRHYPPGRSLNVRKLAEELSVSPTPIREALIRLHGEGLVRRPPGNGAYVAEIGIQGFKDVTEIRLFLMELLAKLAVERITDEEIEEIEELVNELREERDHNEVLHKTSQFHYKLYRATKNETLAKILEILHDQVDRLVFFIPQEMNPTTDLVKDYDSIVAALQARDERKCIEAIRGNKLRFVRLVKQSILDDSLHE